jgi:hypothetical protein
MRSIALKLPDDLIEESSRLADRLRMNPPHGTEPGKTRPVSRRRLGPFANGLGPADGPDVGHRRIEDSFAAPSSDCPVNWLEFSRPRSVLPGVQPAGARFELDVTLRRIVLQGRRAVPQTRAAMDALLAVE